MMRLRAAQALQLVMLLVSASAAAQQVVPQPATAGQALTLMASMPQPSCFNDVTNVNVTHVPGGVRVDYVVVPVTGIICFSASPPLELVAALGTFAPGDYVVTADGTFNGVPNPTITAPFSVQGAAIAPALPAGSAISLIAMASILLLLALKTLALRSSRSPGRRLE